MPYGDGIAAYVPFPDTLPIPTEALLDEPLYSITINRAWFGYLAGAAQALAADSTWQATSEAQLLAITAQATQLVEYLTRPDLAFSISFRENPAYPLSWQYTLDGETTWIDGPANADHFIPIFTPESASPSGYALSVNDLHANINIPLLTASDPNAVVENPVSDLVNVVAPDLDINALKLISEGNADVLTLVSQGIAVGKLLLFVAAL